MLTVHGAEYQNAEVEALASEVAELAAESKTEAIRVALKDRAFQTRRDRIEAALERIREELPNGDFGRPLTKEEEERILGFGPDGV